MSIQVLDCTLRDGGYVNNWHFGFNNIKTIINNLTDAGIDYIECGFLKDAVYDNNKSLFSHQNELLKLLPSNTCKYTLMINYGEYNLTDIPENSPLIFRIAFKKEDINEALIFCKNIINKGNKIFINPMYTNTYTSSELLELVNTVNSMKPFAFTIVDSAGAMKEADLLSVYYLINKNLDKNIKLCFHSHNNLKLSFANSQALIKASKTRDLIIDSTVFSIGRAAGNLATEVITQYINDNYNGSYNLIPVLKVLNEQINPIFKKTPWGYSVPYYLAAINSCHPNYAKFLDENSVSVEKIDKILKKIPEDQKNKFNKSLVESIIV